MMPTIYKRERTMTVLALTALTLKRSAAAFGVAVGAMLPLTGVAAAQDVITIQVNHEMGVGTPTARALEWFGDRVTEETDGAVRFRYFHTHELGSERETYDMLQSGSVQMAVSGGQIVSTLAPEFGALLLPYAFADADHFARVLDGEVGEALHARFLERKGNRVLGWAHRAPRHVTTQGVRIESPGDMENLRIRIREIPVQIDAFRALGASPVPMAFPELYMALQTGTVNAQENPASIMVANNFHEVQDHLILTAHIREAFWWTFSEPAWKKLPEDVRAAFENNIDEAIALANEWEFEEDDRWIDEFGAQGVTVVELTDEARGEFAELVAPVAESYAAQWEDGVYDKIVSLRE